MQMSRKGLLQTLLHTALKNDKQHLIQVFEERWQQFVSFGGGREPFTWAELRRAFENIISAPSSGKPFLLLIDGANEFNGKKQELVGLVLQAARHAHVKVCVASRPWIVFSDAFEDRPHLLLERITQNDIHNYTTACLANNKQYTKLSKLGSIPAATLITTITEKATGVFLWVHLVVQSLLDGLSNADRMSYLPVRLEALPPDLESLYLKLLDGLDKNYFRYACRLFRLVLCNLKLLLLYLWFADTGEDDTALKDEIRPLSEDQISDNLELMNRRLTSRCKGLLEVDNHQQNPNMALSRGRSDHIYKSMLFTNNSTKSRVE